MSDEDKKSLDERIKEAEIKKFIAETNKLELEQEELKRHSNMLWFRKHSSNLLY